MKNQRHAEARNARLAAKNGGKLPEAGKPMVEALIHDHLDQVFAENDALEELHRAQDNAARAYRALSAAEENARIAQEKLKKATILPPVMITMLNARSEIAATMVLKARARLEKYKNAPMKTKDQQKLWDRESYIINDTFQEEMWSTEYSRIEALIKSEQAKLNSPDTD